MKPVASMLTTCAVGNDACEAGFTSNTAQVVVRFYGDYV